MARPPNRDDFRWLLDGVEPYLEANRLKETEDRLNRAAAVVAMAVVDNERRHREEGEHANALLRVAMGMTLD
jgi:hypothetical protein